VRAAHGDSEARVPTLVRTRNGRHRAGSTARSEQTRTFCCFPYADVVPKGRASLRSPWLILGWLAGLLALLTGLATVLVDPGDWQTALVGGLLLLLPGAWAVLRVPLMRVQLGSDGLKVRGFFRTRSTPWESVESITLEEIDDKIVATAFAPVVHRVGMPEQVLMQLAGYTTEGRAASSRMGRQTALIASYRTQR
jgi:hypothetical protein